MVGRRRPRRARGTGPSLPPDPGGEHRQRYGTTRGGAGPGPGHAVLRVLDLVRPDALGAPAFPLVDMDVAAQGICRAVHDLRPGDLADLDAGPGPASTARGDLARRPGPRAGPGPSGRQ